jgi:hypothetical protein
MKANKTTREEEVLNCRRRKDTESESSIDLTVHSQILKQQKQLNGRNHHKPININTECEWPQLSHQKTPFGKLD